MARRVGRLSTLVLATCVLLAAFAAVAWAAESHAGSDTVSDYHERVTRARVLAHEALQDEGPDEIEAFTLATQLNELLPATEVVDVNGTDVQVDNSVMRGMVARLASAPRAAVRLAVIRELSDHLSSLERATGEPGKAVPQDAEALSALLAEENPNSRSALSSLFGDLVDRVGKLLMDWWESIGASPGTSRLLTTITIVILALLTAVLVWVLVRAFLASRVGASKSARGVRAAHVGPVVAAAEGLPDDPLAFAQERAALGDLRGALRALFGGAARLLAEAGVVRQTRTHTNGELLAQVRALGQVAVHGPLASLCGRFERAWYGHHEPDAAAFAAARQEYVEIAAAAAAHGAPDVSGRASDESGDSARAAARGGDSA